MGARSSGALVVGDNGEVARYAPGEGWQPESLLGPGGAPGSRATLLAALAVTVALAVANGERHHGRYRYVVGR